MWVTPDLQEGKYQAFVDITPEKKRIKQIQICYRLKQIKQAKQIF